MGQQVHANDDGPGHNWAYGADASAVQAALDAIRGVGMCCRAIRVGDVSGGAAIYLVRHPGEDERQLTATAVAGETFIEEFFDVGDSTTAADITVFI